MNMGIRIVIGSVATAGIAFFSKGIKRGSPLCKNFLPSPLHKGRGIKGEGLVTPRL